MIKITSLLLLSLLTSCAAMIQPNLKPSPEEDWLSTRRPKCQNPKIKTNCNIDAYKEDRMSYYSSEDTIEDIQLIPLERPKE